MGETIHIKALKYPDIDHYEWEGELIQQTSDYVLLLCKSGRRLKHYTKGKTFTIDNTSLECFSLKDWYTIAMEIDQGEVTAYYCNIAMPSRIENDQLRFVDLDLDLVKPRDEKWKVVDQNEFESNSVKYNYPPELKEKTVQALDELRKKLREKAFPFDGSLLEVLREKQADGMCASLAVPKTQRL